MVRHPRDYRWSSHTVNAEGRASGLITPHALYQALAREDSARRVAYSALFKADLDAQTIDTIRQATNGNYALGNSAFVAQIEDALGRRGQPGKAGRPARSMALVESHDERLL